MSGRQAERRAGEGRLMAIARGVYVVPGTPPTWERDAIAAQLFTTNRLYPSALSHETAGALYGLANCRRGGPIICTSHATDRHPNPLAIMVRASDLLDDDVVIGPLGVPTTSVPRTVLDLALATTRISAIEAIIDDAHQRGLVTLEQLAERFGQAHYRAGIVNVRKALAHLIRRETKRIKAEQLAALRAARRESRREGRLALARQRRLDAVAISSDLAVAS
jgi:predicted transcriptional regulator of viral defense system